eukprot:53609-Prymnesium_polylepis.1
MFPPSNGIEFSNIYLEVDYEPVRAPAWLAKQEQAACGSKAVVIDHSTVRLTWTPERLYKTPTSHWSSHRPTSHHSP